MKKLVLAGVLAAAAGSAFAAAPNATQHRMRIDVNGDGIVTVSELEQSAATRFHKLDGNGDGKLTRAEMEAPRQKWLAAHPQAANDPKRKARSARFDRFTRLDGDKNGAVTFAEYTANVAKRAERLDTNHDGQISREEFVAARAAFRSRRPAQS